MALSKVFFPSVFFVPSVFCVTLGKRALCRVSEKNTRQTLGHSAYSRFPVVSVVSSRMPSVMLNETEEGRQLGLLAHLFT